MGKYLFVYHGGGVAETEEERNESMQAWGRWAGELGSAIVDFGAPISDRTVVGHDGGNPATGYSLIEADSLEAAAELAKGSPILSSDTGSVEVAETIDMSGAG